MTPTGYTETDFARLEEMGWPNRLIGADSFQIAQEHATFKQRRADAIDTRLGVWTFWICMAVFVAMIAALVIGGAA